MGISPSPSLIFILISNGCLCVSMTLINPKSQIMCNSIALIKTFCIFLRYLILDLTTAMWVECFIKPTLKYVSLCRSYSLITAEPGISLTRRESILMYLPLYPTHCLAFCCRFWDISYVGLFWNGHASSLGTLSCSSPAPQLRNGT